MYFPRPVQFAIAIFWGAGISWYALEDLRKISALARKAAEEKHREAELEKQREYHLAEEPYPPRWSC